MKIIQVLETENGHFKVGDLVKINYNTYDEEYNIIGYKTIIGKIIDFPNNRRIIIDISEQYKSNTEILLLYEIISIEKVGE